MKINVVTLCSGYDAQCLALERLKHNYSDFDYELVAWAEIDKYAIQAHNALFPQWKDRNMGDITSCDWSKINDNIDLLTYSTPCQSISSAGKQDGLKKGSGTASSIIWSVLNAIDVLRPKYLLMENVKALVSSKFIGDFHEWQLELEKRGYTNFAKVLNAKDYCIPQNRERIFMVSILDENANYHFPEPFPLDKRLKDVLEEDVDEKYYLSKKIIDTFIERNKINEDKGNGFKFEPTDGDCVASSGLTMPGSRPCDNYIKEPIANVGGEDKLMVVGNIFPSGHNGGNIYGTEGISPTVMENHNNAVIIVDPISCAMRGREVQCLTPKRTEYGKKVRKEYESGDLKESRHNMQQLEPREDGVCNTITSVQKDNLIIEPKIVQKARGFNKGAVMELSPSITSSRWENNNFVSEPVAKVLTKTAQNEPQCYYEGNNEENNKNLDNHEQRGIFKGDYQDFTDKILRILRKHLGEEEIQRKIRRLVSILKKEVLRQRMHEESVCDSGIKRSEVQSCTPLCEEDKISDRGQAEGVRDMRFKEEYRCSPQGWELSEQFATELNDIMSFLPHEDAREINEGLHYMRQTYGVSWVLQQALSSLEEIWGSINGERKESFRIRKLSEREVFRLMDVSEDDIDKIQAAGISRSQQYKLAGNSIVTSVLYHLFRKLFIDTSCESKQLSIF